MQYGYQVWVSSRRRVTRVVGYGLMSLAGLATMVWPAPSVAAAADGARYLAYVWAAMLALGGVSSAIGAATDRWLGEYAGLWPLITTFFVYAITVAIAVNVNRLSAVGVAALLGSIGFLLLSRWRDVAAVRRAATSHSKGPKEW